MRSIPFYAGMTICLIIGALAAISEMIAGTRLDDIAEWWATR